MSPEIPPNSLHIPELVGRLCRRTNLLQDPNETYTHLTNSYYRLLRFHTTLTTFPHLIRHVCRLSISPILGSTITQKTLEKICNIPFTHLESVFMFIRKRLDYQQFFSVLTVVHKLDIFLEDVSFFCGCLTVLLARTPTPQTRRVA
jgi:hypothetical protein